MHYNHCDFMAWTLSIFTSALDVLEAGLRHSIWLWVSLAGGVVLGLCARQARQVIVCSLLSVGAFSLVLCGVLSLVVWMDVRYQLTAPVRALAAWQQYTADPSGKRILVLNAPNQISLNSSIPGLPPESEVLETPNLATGQTLIFAQMIEGDIGAPGRINGMTAHYATEHKFDHTQMVSQTTAHDVVIVAGGSAKGYQARVVGERAAALDHNPTKSAPSYLARFESKGQVVLLQTAHACFEGGLLERTLVTHTTLQVAAGFPATAKLFRHALAEASQQQIGGSDASLFGGLLELYELALGKSYTDINDIRLGNMLSQPDIDRVRLGLYDWQTGERWLALKVDGAQWPDNAVIIDAQLMCE